jgi:DNA-binding XRE family transcriptional regulator
MDTAEQNNSPNASNPAHVGATVARLRRAHGLSRQQVATAVGLSLATIRRIEVGRLDARIGWLRSIASALGLTLADVVSAIEVGHG